MKWLFAAAAAVCLFACGGPQDEAGLEKQARGGDVLCDGSVSSGCGTADPMLGSWHDWNGNKITIDSSGNATINFWVNSCYTPGQVIYSGLTRCGGGVTCPSGSSWVGHTVTLTGFTLQGSCGGPYTSTSDLFDDTTLTGGSGFTDSGHGWTWARG